MRFDYGQNAFQLSNLYSGSGPLDAFGTATGAAQTSKTYAGNTCSSATPCYTYPNSYGPQTALYQAYLNNGRAREIGVDFLGHYHIPGTKLTAFGMFQWFMPNDNVNENPLDFMRFVAGVSYQYNEYLRFALDSQNLLFYHDQFACRSRMRSSSTMCRAARSMVACCRKRARFRTWCRSIRTRSS